MIVVTVSRDTNKCVVTCDREVGWYLLPYSTAFPSVTSIPVTFAGHLNLVSTYTWGIARTLRSGRIYASDHMGVRNMFANMCMTLRVRGAMLLSLRAQGSANRKTGLG